MDVSVRSIPQREATVVMRLTAERHDVRNLVAEGLLTVREAQRFLGIGRSKLYQLMADGQLPYVRIGSVRRLPRAGLIDYATRNLRGV